MAHTVSAPDKPFQPDKPYRYFSTGQTSTQSVGKRWLLWDSFGVWRKLGLVVSESMPTGWTAERRKRQAELIRTWEPWAKSTGPKSPAGRQRVGRNAFKGGHWLQLRELSKMVNSEIRQARELIESC